MLDSSVTVVTHGASIDVLIYTFGGPLTDLGDEIFQYCRDQGQPIGESAGLYAYDPATGSLALTDGVSSADHRVVVFDWATESDRVQGGFDEAAGDALFAMLAENEMLSSDYLHLIGHSRGTIVNSEAAQRLLHYGYSVDHMTILDTETGGHIFPDLAQAGPAHAWEGIGFVDNYWGNAPSLRGEPVNGAHNVDLAEGVPPVGDIDEPPDGDVGHSEVWEWYLQTVRDDSASEGYHWRRNSALQPDAPVDGERTPLEAPPGVVNGDFEYGALADSNVAGWAYHGGQGTARVDALYSGSGHGYTMELDYDDLSKWHNRSYVPKTATHLIFDARVLDASDDDELQVGIVEPSTGTSSGSTGVVPLESTSGWTTYPWPIAGFEGSVVSVGFDIVASIPDSQVRIDNVRFNPPAPNVASRTTEVGPEIAEGAWQIDNDPYFYWTPTDSFEGYSFAMDSDPDEVVDTTTAWHQYPTDSIPDGQHTFKVKGRNSLGDWSPVATFEIWIDSAAESIDGLGARTSSSGPEIPEGQWQDDNDPYFFWDEPVSLSPLAGYSVSVDVLPDDTLDIPPTEPGTSYPLSAGEHTFYVSAIDEAGNVGTPASFEIWVNEGAPPPNSPPIITGLSVLPASVARGNSVRLQANGVSDPDGIVQWVEFYRDSSGDGIGQVDEYLGADFSPAGGWDLYASTSGWPIGAVTILARAADDWSLTGNWTSGSLDVVDEATVPEVSDIPNQTIYAGESFASIGLDEFVFDPDTPDGALQWTYTGNSQLTVSIDTDRVATVIYPLGWVGEEWITFHASDGTATVGDEVIFKVEVPPEPPVVAGIPNEVVYEGRPFAQIDLDSYVTDPDTPVEALAWSYSGNSQLSVTIGPARIATVSVPSSTWTGTETIAFTATDGTWLTDSDSATFEVLSTDAPRVCSVSPTPNTILTSGPSSVLLRFDKPLDPASAEQPVNYLLVSSGGDGQFDDGNETTLSIDSATYDSAAKTVVLRVNGGVPIGDDSYRLTLAAAGVVGLDGAALDGELDGSALPSGDGTPGGDFITFFQVAAAGNVFSPFPRDLIHEAGVEWVFNAATGHEYALTMAGTWEHAVEQATRMGGSLATVGSIQENDWLHGAFFSGGATEPKWIGLSDTDADGAWTWQSGASGHWQLDDPNSDTFVNWAGGQPDGLGRRNQEIAPDAGRAAQASLTWGPPDSDGDIGDFGLFWSDEALDGSLYQGIVERPAFLYGITRADLDGDGDTDIVEVLPDDHRVAWWENTANTSQGAYVRHYVGEMNYPTSVAPADVDRDGDTDLVIAVTGDSAVTWWENEGGTTFIRHAVGDLQSARAVTSADIDADGDIDVVGQGDTGDLYWFEQRPGATFVSHVIDNYLGFWCSVAVGDLNGDGSPDVIAADSEGDVIYWYDNAQQSGRHVVGDAFGGARSVDAVDVDGDGHIDVLGAGWTQDEIRRYQNNGQGSFQPHSLPGTNSGASCVYGTDIDGDGDMDVVGTSQWVHKVSVYENNGQQSFTEHVLTTSLGNAVSACVGDFDGDGDLDVAASGTAPSTGPVQFWEQTGTPGPTVERTIPATEGTWHTAAPAFLDLRFDKPLDFSSFTGSVLSVTRGMESIDIDSAVAAIDPQTARFTFSQGVLSDGAYHVALQPHAVRGLGSGSGLSHQGFLRVDTEAPTGLSDAHSTSHSASVWSNDNTIDIEWTAASDAVSGFAGYSLLWSTDPTGEPDAVPDTLELTHTSPVLPDGDSHFFHARGIDGAGNASDTVHVGPFWLDTSVPSAPTIAPEIDVDTGRINDDLITADDTPGLSGVAEPGTTVDVLVNGVPHAQVLAGPDGTWGLDLPSVGGGTQVLSIAARASDLAGNVSPMSDALTVTVDREAPSFVSSEPSQGAAIAPFASIVFHLSDAGGLDLVATGQTIVATLDGVPFGDFLVDTSVVDQITVELTTAQSGDYGFGLTPIDLAGNSAGPVDLDVSTPLQFTEGQQLVSSAAWDVACADLDGDGDDDIVGAITDENAISWWENTRGGSFVRHEIGATDYPTGVDSVDMDGDGDMDVVVASCSSSGKVSWWQNSGGGTFTEQVVDEGPSRHMSYTQFVTSGDIDGDGDTDIAAKGDEGQLYWFERQLDGSFTAHYIDYHGNDSAAGIALAHVNADDHLDLLAADPITGTIYWYDDAQQSGRQIVAQGLGGACGVHAGHVDTGEQIDVLVAASTHDGGTLRWYGDEGGGAFGSQMHNLPGQNSGASSVHATDIDGDGDTDIVGTSEGVHKVAVYLNDGQQTFTERVLTTTATLGGAFAVAVGDVDADGDLDVVAAGRAASGGGIRWWEQEGETTGPRVASTVPSPQSAVTVAPTSIQVDFTEAMSVASVYDLDSYQLMSSGGDGTFGDGNEGSVQIESVSYDSDLARATLLLSPHGLTDDSYRLTLSGADSLRDVYGNRLDGEYIDTFPSGDGTPGGDFTISFAVDATPPTVLNWSLEEDTGTDADDKVTNDVTPEFTFTFSEPVYLEPSDVAIASPDGTPVVPGAITGSGTATVGIASIPALGIDGQHTIRLKGTGTIRDAAGNALNGGSDEVLSFTLDTTAPNVTVDTRTTSDQTPTLTGTLDDALAAVQVTVTGTTYVATNNGDGTWTLPDNTITPALGQGVYDVQVVATDVAGNMGSDSTADELRVDWNDAPVLTPIGDQSVDEENELSFTVTASDPHDDPADTVTLSATGLPTGASFYSDTGQFAWTPTESQQGTHQVTLTATDDGTPPLSDSEIVTITVNEINDAPVLDPIGSQSVDEESGLAFTVTASDPDDDPANTVTLSATGLPTGASFDPSIGQFAWTPTESQQGSYLVAFTATDDGTSPLNDSENVTITVNEINDAPVLDPVGNQTIDEENELSFTVTASDPDDDPANTVTLSAAGLPADATFDPSTGQFTWTPTEAQQGSHQVTFTATDDGISPLSDSEVVTITVNEINDAPVLDPVGSQSVDEENELAFTVTASDPDDDPGNTVTLSATGLPTGATFEPSTGQLTWTPTESQQGSYNVTFTATDDGISPLSDSEIVTITVNEINDAPVLDPISSQTIDEENELAFTVTASDPDDSPANSVTLSATDLPTGAAFDASTGQFAWTPTESQQGTHNVTFAATDDGISPLSDSEVVTITVNEVNDAPVLDPIGSQSTDEESQLAFTVTASDPDDDPANTVTLSATGLPTGASFDPSTGQLTWTPTEAQQGSYSVTFIATDDGISPLSDSEAVTITVNEVNDAPVLNPIGNQSVDEQNELAFTITASDPNDDPANTVTLSATSLPSRASFDPSTGQFTWTPTESQQGTHQVTFTATDDGPSPLSDSEVVAITVNEINDAPVLEPVGSQTVDEEHELTFTATASDPHDDPANTVTLTAAGLPTGASFDPSTGHFIWTPGESQQGSYNVTFTATDDGITPLSDSEIVTITVNEVNDEPVLDSIGSQSVDEEHELAFTVTASDPNDHPPNTVTLSATGLPPGASFDPSTGQFTWTPTEAQDGTYAVTFTATDDGAPELSDWEIVEITVNEVGFYVVDLSVTDSGFAARLSREADVAALNLYDGPDAASDPTDVVLSGDAVGVVAGSVVWDAATQAMHFVRTGGPLEPDTYTLHLFSRADGFVDTTGELLDGDGDGLPGGDYEHHFTVDGALGRVVSLPDFARGPGQPVDVPGTSTGLPLSIDDASGVQALDLELTFDPELLDVAGVGLASGMPDDWQVTASIEPGRATIGASGTDPLPSGARELITLVARIPGGAPYGAAEVLRLESVQLNAGTIEARGDAALHVAAYLGDATGNGAYSGLDASYIARICVSLDTGFDAYDLVDPLIVGDVTGNGRLSGLDASYVARKSVGRFQPEIPDIPAALDPAAAGAQASASSIAENPSMGDDGSDPEQASARTAHDSAMVRSSVGPQEAPDTAATEADGDARGPARVANLPADVPSAVTHEPMPAPRVPVSAREGAHRDADGNDGGLAVEPVIGGERLPAEPIDQARDAQSSDDVSPSAGTAAPASLPAVPHALPGHAPALNAGELNLADKATSPRPAAVVSYVTAPSEMQVVGLVVDERGKVTGWL